MSAAVATVYQDTDGVTMVGSAGYNACIGFKFAAFLAQSGKANALALSSSMSWSRICGRSYFLHSSFGGLCQLKPFIGDLQPRRFV